MDKMSVLRIGDKRDVTRLRLLYLGKTAYLYVLVTYNASRYHGRYYLWRYFHLITVLFTELSESIQGIRKEFIWNSKINIYY